MGYGGVWQIFHAATTICTFECVDSFASFCLYDYVGLAIRIVVMVVVVVVLAQQLQQY